MASSPVLLRPGARMVAVGDSGTQFNAAASFSVLCGSKSTPIVSPLVPGTGYRTGDLLTVAGGRGQMAPCQLRVTAVTGPGRVSAVELVSFGIHAIMPPARGAPTEGGSGSGCTVNFNVLVTSAGSGYRAGDVVSVQSFIIDEPATLSVQAVTASGGITRVSILQHGLYRYVEGSVDYPLAGGSGSGALIRTSAATTTALPASYGAMLEYRQGGQISWARGYDPRFVHEIWLDPRATGALRASSFGATTAQATGNPYFSGANLGLSGDTASGAAKRRKAVIGTGAEIMRYAAGANLGTTDNAVAVVTARIAEEVRAYRQAGRAVILSTIHPRSAGIRTGQAGGLATIAGSSLVTLTLPGHGMRPGQIGGDIRIQAQERVGGIQFTGQIRRTVADARGTADELVVEMMDQVASASASGGGRVVVDRLGPGHQLGFLPGDPRWRRYYEINAWIRANASRLGAVLEDPWDDLRHPSPPSGEAGEADVAVLRDGAHLAALGGFRAQKSAAEAMARIVAKGIWFDPDPRAANLLERGSFRGTDGVTGLGVSGRVATGWQVSNINGAGQAVIVNVSMEPAANADRAVLVLTCVSSGGGAAGTVNNIRLAPVTPPVSGFVPADWLQGFFEIEHIAGGPGVSVSAALGSGNLFSPNISVRDLSGQTGETPVRGAHRRWLITPRMQVDRRPDIKAQLDLQVRADIAGTTVLKVSAAILRKVGSPVTQFPWSA